MKVVITPSFPQISNPEEILQLKDILVDLKEEPDHVLDMYGPDARKKGRLRYNRKQLLPRYHGREWQRNRLKVSYNQGRRASGDRVEEAARSVRVVTYGKGSETSPSTCLPYMYDCRRVRHTYMLCCNPRPRGWLFQSKRGNCTNSPGSATLTEERRSRSQYAFKEEVVQGGLASLLFSVQPWRPAVASRRSGHASVQLLATAPVSLKRFVPTESGPPVVVSTCGPGAAAASPSFWRANTRAS